MKKSNASNLDLSNENLIKAFGKFNQSNPSSTKIAVARFMATRKKVNQGTICRNKSKDFSKGICSKTVSKIIKDFKLNKMVEIEIIRKGTIILYGLTEDFKNELAHQ